MKRIGKEIEVESTAEMPLRFFWNEKWYHIETVQDAWVLQGMWWVKEEKRRYFRVLTQRGIAIIYVRETELESPIWVLDEIFD